MNASSSYLSQQPLGNSKNRSSRFGTPSLRRTSVGNRSESPNISMDIDSVKLPGRQFEDARVFAHSDTLSVRLAASLPIEVRQAFQTADPTRDIFTGSVHVFNRTTSYAVVVSVETCFVWKIDLDSSSLSPTCYMFPLPPPDLSSPYLNVPFASLVSFGSSREPGLMLVSTSGEVRFWDSIGTGLAGAERYTTTQIDLSENEAVTGLTCVDAMVYVAMSKTRLYRLTVTARPGTGKFHVILTPFNDPEDHGSSWRSPFRILQRKGSFADSGNIIAIASLFEDQAFPKTRDIIQRESDEKTIWVLTSKNLMEWNVNLGGSEQCVHNHEVRKIVVDAIMADVEGDRHLLDIELLDVAVDCNGDPVLLISHGPFPDQTPTSLDLTAPVRIYALVRLQFSPTAGTFKVKKDGIQILPYELAADPRRASSPQLTMLHSSGSGDDLELAVTQFADAFAFTAFEPPYQEQLHLKNVNDMIFGFNVLKHAEGRDVLLLTVGMVLAARPNISNIVKMKDDVHIGKANVLKSTIRQAMKYAIKPENPLRFQLPGIADGESLTTAAEQMSHAFLTSDPDVVSPALSMGAQLASRESSLQALVSFIAESGGLSKLSQSTREQLLADAEKLAAAQGIWAYHNEQAQKSVLPNILPSAVETYMRRVNKSDDGDAMRQFFNSQVPYIGMLVPEIVGILESEPPSIGVSDKDAHLLVQANGLVLALFTAAFEYRTRNRAKYQLSRAFVQSWTSDPTLVSNLRRLFETTVKFLTQMQASSRHNEKSAGSGGIHEVLTGQLRELASCLFKAYGDRLEFLDIHSQDGGSSERERNRLEEEFQSMRPAVLGHLVRLGCTEHAFKLAETYRDFQALSELSYHASADQTVAASERIRNYINRFQEDFTSQLYKWYIQQGKLRLLFEQETEYDDHIDAFFSRNPTPRLSWIHDVGKQHYQSAASALLAAADAETNLETRHVMLSIGKLTSMADGPAATPQDKLKAFNHSLDFMAIHESLLQQLNEDLGQPAKFAIESRVRAITSAKCVIPSDRPALQEHFQRILRQLLQGNVLTEEDAVDLLSMKDNTKSPTNFVDALTILSNSSTLSERHKLTAIQNVWRRIYLHDEQVPHWKHIRDTANKTDYELTVSLRNTQLYQVLALSALPVTVIALPSTAAEVPTPEEIELRWPGLAPNQVYELCQDLARESSVLTDHGPSDADFGHVRKLVEEDKKTSSAQRG